jgi:hypothetical protein
MTVDYREILMRALERVDTRSVETRLSIYQLARSTLMDELRSGRPPLSPSQQLKEVVLLSRAISAVEGEMFGNMLRASERGDAVNVLEGPNPTQLYRDRALAYSPSTRMLVPADELDNHIEDRVANAVQRSSRAILHQARPQLALRVARTTADLAYGAVFGAVAVLLIAGVSIESSRTSAKVAGDAQTVQTVRPRTSMVEVPASYGVYADLRGKLVEMNSLSVVPFDPRAKTVLQVKERNSVRLPDHAPQFFAYRRDFLTSAPDRIPLRVVALLARVMKFDVSGKVVTEVDGNTWILRPSPYELRVAPVADNKEMIKVTSGAVQLPAGRYAMMLSEQYYDFTVEGNVTDPAQCVESAPTARGPIFYDCPPVAGAK